MLDRERRRRGNRRQQRYPDLDALAREFETRAARHDDEAVARLDSEPRQPADQFVQRVVAADVLQHMERHTAIRRHPACSVQTAGERIGRLMRGHRLHGIQYLRIGK